MGGELLLEQGSLPVAVSLIMEALVFFVIFLWILVYVCCTVPKYFILFG